ncbi:MAG: hypothetical protein ACYTG6_01965 [Planctomycetota bacterium]
MSRPDPFPDLPPGTPFLLALLVGTGWLAVRIRIARRRAGRRGPEDPPPEGWPWTHRLAATRWVLPALGVLALLLAAATAWHFARH